MEHPFINNLDNLTPDQLMEKINELNKKLMIGMRTGNQHLCNQIRMALESYQSKYNEKVRAQWAARSGQGKDYGDKIDIS